jgi:hypothetical protein
VRGTYIKVVGTVIVVADGNILHNVFIIMVWFAILSGTVPKVGLNVATFAGVATVKGITVFMREGTVAGIAASTSADRMKTKELGATFMSEMENCVIKILELYKESPDSVPVIVTIPGCNNVTSFPLMVAFSEDVYVHAPVLSLGLVGSTIVNEGFVIDLFVICSALTRGVGRLTTSVVEIVVDKKLAVLA